MQEHGGGRAVIGLMGLDFRGLESVLESTFAKKPQVVKINMDAAKAGYDYAAAHFTPPAQLRQASQNGPWSGHELMAMGAALAGCKFYCGTDEPRDTHTGMVRGPWEGNGYLCPAG